MQQEKPSAFSNVRVSLVGKDSFLATATVKVADVLYVTGLRVIDGKKGPFVSMPCKKLQSGEYKDIVFPANGEARNELTELVLVEYRRQLALTNPKGATNV